jgi:outer membrane biosynthesis protein TonB
MTNCLYGSCRSRSGVVGRFLLALMTLLLCLVLGSVSGATAQNAPPAKTKRKVVVMVEPDYPYILRNGHFEGQVRLEATVLPNGNVSKVEPKGGNPMLSQYAAQAVMHWKYAPGPAQTLEEVVFSFNPK